ncbi:hypothetical protein AM1_4388 [Acaryochloris marina MBIC11017]|uniref:Uncharacterized protein n=1 Tax=Acaryochloris marina (strain MBIC 11017) TaxID=329726 RepID=B0CEX0_ACAM1|nr:hypothetical protein AM1_4388 [Acaryochloris marina MBIC11017]
MNVLLGMFVIMLEPILLTGTAASVAQGIGKLICSLPRK